MRVSATASSSPSPAAPPRAIGRHPTVEGCSAWWKWLGLAGVVGVAATGAAVARQERQRRAYTPDEVRARLHERLAEAEDRPD